MLTYSEIESIIHSKLFIHRRRLIFPMKSWIVLWILLLPSSDGQLNKPLCVTGKFYANGYQVVEGEYQKTNYHPKEKLCRVEIEVAVLCDVKTISMTGSVADIMKLEAGTCVMARKKEKTIQCFCNDVKECNKQPSTIWNMLTNSPRLNNDMDYMELKGCVLELLQEVYNYPVRIRNTTIDGSIANVTTIVRRTTTTIAPPENEDKLSYDETFAACKIPKEKKKEKRTINYRSFYDRYGLIYLYCFVLMTLAIIWQIRRYIVNRYDLQSDLSLWFEKTKEDKMLWAERFRASNRDYRREYTRAGEEYWTEVKKREKMAQKIRVAEWKDRYERSGECNWVDGDGHPPDKLYTSEAIEQRAHEWAVREERVTLLIQEADADVVADIEAQEKAREEDRRQRDQLLSNIAQSKEMVAIKRRSRRRRLIK